MALSKPMKKENSNKFEPKLDVPYDVRILGFAELGTQEVKDFNSKDEDAKELKDQIAVVLQFIGYTVETDDEDEDGLPITIYNPCVKKAGGKEYPQIETMVKNLSTGAKSFVGQIFDAAGPKVRDAQGNVNPVLAVGKLITMTRVIEPIAGKDQEIWKSTRMAAAQKKTVEILDDMPTFLFDLLDEDGEPSEGFFEDFDSEFPEAAGMMLVSKLISSSEYVEKIEGTECYLDTLIEELREIHGTFDDKPVKGKKKATRKEVPKKAAEKTKPKTKAKAPEVDEDEVDDEAEAAQVKKEAAAKKKKRIADAKRLKEQADQLDEELNAEAEAAEDGAEDGAEETEEEAEAREMEEFKAEQKAKKLKKAKAKKEADAGTESEDGDDVDPF